MNIFMIQMLIQININVKHVLKHITLQMKNVVKKDIIITLQVVHVKIF